MSDPENKNSAFKTDENKLDLEDILAEFSKDSDSSQINSASTNRDSVHHPAAEKENKDANPVFESTEDSIPEAQKVENTLSESGAKDNIIAEEAVKPEGKHKSARSSELEHTLKSENTEPHTPEPKITTGKKRDGERKTKKKPDSVKRSPTILYVIIVVSVLIVILIILFHFSNQSVQATSEVTPTVNVTIVPETKSTDTPEVDSVDSKFLADLEKSITALLSSDEANIREASKANLESALELLAPYSEEQFSDETVGTIAQNYIAALTKESESFEVQFEESDLLWYEGYVLQMQMLTRLNSSYGFMTGNKAFQEKLVAPLSEVSAFYNKYSIISKDIRGQIDAITYLDYVNDYRYKTTLKNRTNYTFDIIFYFDNYNENLPEDAEEAELIEPASSAEDELTDITPLKSYVVTDRVTSGVAKMKTFVCHWTITSID